MKNLNIKTIILISVSLMFIGTPFAAFAADKWNETPEFNHDDEAAIATTESVRFNHTSPPVNVWIETPDLSVDKEEHDARIDKASVHIHHIDKKMYAETPELS